MRFKTVNFVSLPLPFPASADGLPVVGALGMDLFWDADVGLDFAHRKMTLYAQDHCPGQVVYWSDNYATAPFRQSELGNIYFPMALGGKKMEATLDPSSPTTNLRADVSMKLYGFDERSPELETITDPSGRTQQQFRAMTLTSPGVTIRNLRIKLLPKVDYCHVVFTSEKDPVAEYDCRGSVPLDLGMNLLQKLHIYLATKEKMIYFTGIDPVPPAPETTSPQTGEK